MIDLRVVASCVDHRYLHLILMPTEACNFRCHYCYEHFQYKRMAPDVVRGVKELLRRRMPGLTSLEVAWFGGEPLLARDIIADVMEHVRSLRANVATEVHSDITTNAYLLTSAVLRDLMSLGITRYQISFDGPREFHDRKRVLAGGKGTFDRVWGNMLAMRADPGEFHVLVRVHADRENRDALPEFIDQYGAAFGADERFELFLRPLSRLGGPHDADLSVFDDEESARVTAALRTHAAKQGIRQAPLKPDLPICYAAKGNSFLIRANGRINKCTVALEHPENQVGRILPDGTMQVDTPRTLKWMRGLQSGDRLELACPMKGLAEPVADAVVREDVPLLAGTSGGRV